MSGLDRKNHKGLTISIIISLLFSVIYAAFPSRMHFADGLYYAFHLEDFPISHSWHQHHLIWLPLMHLIYGALHAILPSISAMTFLQVSNAIMGGLIIFTLIQLVRRISGSNLAGNIAGLALGFTWGMMNYAADANIYILILLLMLFTGLIITRRDTMSIKQAYLATVLMILISLLHQIGFFFSFAILAAILTRTDKSVRTKTAISCTILYACITFGSYYGVYRIIHHLLPVELQESFFSWLTAYGSHSSFWTMQKEGFLSAQIIFERSQFNLLFHMKDALLALYYQDYSESYNTWVLFIFFQMIILLSVLFELKNVILYKDPRRNQKIFLLTWFFPYFIFNQFYCAFEIHYKLFYLMPLITLWSIQSLEAPPQERKAWNILVLLVIVGMAGWNITTGIIPNSRPDHNPYLQEVMKIKPELNEDDLIIFARHERYKAAIARYYTHTDAIFYQTSFRYLSSDPDAYEKLNVETIEYFNSRYNRIIISNPASTSGFENWYFSGHLLAPPHPDFLAMKKSDLLFIFSSSGKLYVIEPDYSSINPHPLNIKSEN